MLVCLSLVNLAMGFALRFEEVAGVPAAGYFGMIVAVAVFVAAALAKGAVFVDAAMSIVVLGLIGGFAFVPMAGGLGSVPVAQLIIDGSNSVFGVVFAIVLVAVCERNKYACLPLFSWMYGISGICTTVGALLGTSANHFVSVGDTGLVNALSASLVVVVAAYALFGLRGFSFADTIRGVTDPAPDACAENADNLEERCLLIANHLGLTQRERDVFVLLVSGADRARIEDELSISRNTVKVHVRHIYEKLDVHSHQELLGLVERSDALLAATPARPAPKRGRPRKGE